MTVQVVLTLPCDLQNELRALRHLYIMAAFQQTGGRVTAAARLLNVPLRSLLHWRHDCLHRTEAVMAELEAARR